MTYVWFSIDFYVQEATVHVFKSDHATRVVLYFYKGVRPILFNTFAPEIRFLEPNNTPVEKMVRTFLTLSEDDASQMRRRAAALHASFGQIDTALALAPVTNSPQEGPQVADMANTMERSNATLPLTVCLSPPFRSFFEAIGRHHIDNGGGEDVVDPNLPYFGNTLYPSPEVAAFAVKEELTVEPLGARADRTVAATGEEEEEPAGTSAASSSLPISLLLQRLATVSFQLMHPEYFIRLGEVMGPESHGGTGVDDTEKKADAKAPKLSEAVAFHEHLGVRRQMVQACSAWLDHAGDGYGDMPFDSYLSVVKLFASAVLQAPGLGNLAASKAHESSNAMMPPPFAAAESDLHFSAFFGPSSVANDATALGRWFDDATVASVDDGTTTRQKSAPAVPGAGGATEPSRSTLRHELRRAVMRQQWCVGMSTGVWLLAKLWCELQPFVDAGSVLPTLSLLVSQVDRTAPTALVFLCTLLLVFCTEDEQLAAPGRDVTPAPSVAASDSYYQYLLTAVCDAASVATAATVAVADSMLLYFGGPRASKASLALQQRIDHAFVDCCLGVGALEPRDVAPERSGTVAASNLFLRTLLPRITADDAADRESAWFDVFRLVAAAVPDDDAEERGHAARSSAVIDCAEVLARAIMAAFDEGIREEVSRTVGNPSSPAGRQRPQSASCNDQPAAGGTDAGRPRPANRYWEDVLRFVSRYPTMTDPVRRFLSRTFAVVAGSDDASRGAAALSAAAQTHVEVDRASSSSSDRSAPPVIVNYPTEVFPALCDFFRRFLEILLPARTDAADGVDHPRKMPPSPEAVVDASQDRVACRRHVQSLYLAATVVARCVCVRLALPTATVPLRKSQEDETSQGCLPPPWYPTISAALSTMERPMAVTTTQATAGLSNGAAFFGGRLFAYLVAYGNVIDTLLAKASDAAAESTHRQPPTCPTDGGRSRFVSDDRAAATPSPLSFVSLVLDALRDGEATMGASVKTWDATARRRAGRAWLVLWAAQQQQPQRDTEETITSAERTRLIAFSDDCDRVETVVTEWSSLSYGAEQRPAAAGGTEDRTADGDEHTTAATVALGALRALFRHAAGVPAADAVAPFVTRCRRLLDHLVGRLDLSTAAAKGVTTMTMAAGADDAIELLMSHMSLRLQWAEEDVTRFGVVEAVLLGPKQAATASSNSSASSRAVTRVAVTSSSGDVPVLRPSATTVLQCWLFAPLSDLASASVHCGALGLAESILKETIYFSGLDKNGELPPGEPQQEGPSSDASERGATGLIALELCRLYSASLAIGVDEEGSFVRKNEAEELQRSFLTGCTNGSLDLVSLLNGRDSFAETADQAPADDSDGDTLGQAAWWTFLSDPPEGAATLGGATLPRWTNQLAARYAILGPPWIDAEATLPSDVMRPDGRRQRAWFLTALDRCSTAYSSQLKEDERPSISESVDSPMASLRRVAAWQSVRAGMTHQHRSDLLTRTLALVVTLFQTLLRLQEEAIPSVSPPSSSVSRWTIVEALSNMREAVFDVLLHSEGFLSPVAQPHRAASTTTTEGFAKLRHNIHLAAEAVRETVTLGFHTGAPSCGSADGSARQRGGPPPGTVMPGLENAARIALKRFLVEAAMGQRQQNWLRGGVREEGGGPTSEEEVGTVMTASLKNSWARSIARQVTLLRWLVALGASSDELVVVAASCARLVSSRELMTNWWVATIADAADPWMDLVSKVHPGHSVSQRLHFLVSQAMQPFSSSHDDPTSSSSATTPMPPSDSLGGFMVAVGDVAGDLLHDVSRWLMVACREGVSPDHVSSAANGGWQLSAEFVAFAHEEWAAAQAASDHPRVLKQTDLPAPSHRMCFAFVASTLPLRSSATTSDSGESDFLWHAIAPAAAEMGPAITNNNVTPPSSVGTLSATRVVHQIVRRSLVECEILALSRYEADVASGGGTRAQGRLPDPVAVWDAGTEQLMPISLPPGATSADHVLLSFLAMYQRHFTAITTTSEALNLKSFSSQRHPSSSGPLIGCKTALSDGEVGRLVLVVLHLASRFSSKEAAPPPSSSPPAVADPRHFWHTWLVSLAECCLSVIHDAVVLQAFVVEAEGGGSGAAGSSGELQAASRESVLSVVADALVSYSKREDNADGWQLAQTPAKELARRWARNGLLNSFRSFSAVITEATQLRILTRVWAAANERSGASCVVPLRADLAAAIDAVRASHALIEVGQQAGLTDLRKPISFLDWTPAVASRVIDRIAATKDFAGAFLFLFHASTKSQPQLATHLLDLLVQVHVAAVKAEFDAMASSTRNANPSTSSPPLTSVTARSMASSETAALMYVVRLFTPQDLPREAQDAQRLLLARVKASAPVGVRVVTALTDNKLPPYCGPPFAAEVHLSFVHRMLRFCLTSAKTQALFTGQPRWARTLMGARALQCFQSQPMLLSPTDPVVCAFPPGAGWLEHPQLVVENLVMNGRLRECRVVLAASELHVDEVLLEYASRAANTETLLNPKGSGFPEPLTGEFDFEPEAKRTWPDPFRVILKPDQSEAERNRLRQHFAFPDVPDVALVRGLSLLCNDGGFAANHIFEELAVTLFDRFSDHGTSYGSTLQATLVAVGESLLDVALELLTCVGSSTVGATAADRNHHPSGRRSPTANGVVDSGPSSPEQHQQVQSMKVLKDLFAVQRHIVGTDCAELMPSYHELTNDPAKASNFVQLLLSGSHHKAALAMARTSCCSRDKGAEALLVTQALSMIGLGLVQEAVDTLAMLPPTVVARDLVSVVTTTIEQTPVCASHYAKVDPVTKTASLVVLTPADVPVILEDRRRVVRALVEMYGSPEEAVATHIRQGSFAQALAKAITAGVSPSTVASLVQGTAELGAGDASMAKYQVALRDRDPSLQDVRPFVDATTQLLSDMCGSATGAVTGSAASTMAVPLPLSAQGGGATTSVLAKRLYQLAAWCAWCHDYGRAATTYLRLSVEAAGGEEHRAILRKAEECLVHAKWQLKPADFQTTERSRLPQSDDGVILPPSDLEPERAQQLLIQVRLMLEVVLLLGGSGGGGAGGSTSGPGGVSSLFAGRQGVLNTIDRLFALGTPASAELAVNVALSGGALNSGAGGRPPLPLVDLLATPLSMMAKAKKFDSIEAVAEMIHKSYAIAPDEKNRVLLEIVRVAHDQGRGKLAENTIDRITPEPGDCRFRALVHCGKLLDAYTAAATQRDCQQVAALRRLCATHSTTNAAHVAELAKQFLQKHAPQLLRE